MSAHVSALSSGVLRDVGSTAEESLPEPVTSEDLNDIAAARAGDGDAYARLIERYERAIHVQMYRFSRDPAVCRELVQDVFVEAYLSLHTFRGQAPFLHWLRRVATRTGYRHWTREARARKLQTALELGISPEPAQQSPSDAAALLFEILSQLPAKDRLVLTLFYYDSCSAQEIAAQTGWSETLVRVRLHRSRNRLRKLIESNSKWSEAL